MKFLLAILVPLLASAATQFSITGPATARVGSTVVLVVSASGTPDTGAAAFQWSLVPPAGYTATVAAGSSATTAGKTGLVCTPDSLNCIVYGPNQTVIANGAVVTYSVKVPSAALPGTTSVSLNNIRGVDANGVVLPAISSAAVNIQILPSISDLNGDGKTDITDVNLMAQMAVASIANPSTCTADQNGDGKCDVADVMQVILRMLGF